MTGGERLGERLGSGLLTDLIRRSLEEEARRTGLSVEEVRLQAQERREEWEKEARRGREAEAAERERRLVEALRHPDAAITRSRTALGRVIRWTSSRYNPLRKDEVLDAILRATAPVPDLVGAACVRSASFSCGTFTPSSAMDAGSDYELRVTDEGVFLVADFDTPEQRVYEIRRTPNGDRRGR